MRFVLLLSILLLIGCSSNPVERSAQSIITDGIDRNYPSMTVKASGESRVSMYDVNASTINGSMLDNTVPVPVPIGIEPFTFLNAYGLQVFYGTTYYIEDGISSNVAEDSHSAKWSGEWIFYINQMAYNPYPFYVKTSVRKFHVPTGQWYEVQPPSDNPAWNYVEAARDGEVYLVGKAQIDNAGSQIYVYDNDQLVFSLTDGFYLQPTLSTDGNMVGWCQRGSFIDMDLYIRDLTTNQTTMIYDAQWGDNYVGSVGEMCQNIRIAENGLTSFTIVRLECTKREELPNGVKYTWTTQSQLLYIYDGEGIRQVENTLDWVEQHQFNNTGHELVWSGFDDPATNALNDTVQMTDIHSLIAQTIITGNHNIPDSRVDIDNQGNVIHSSCASVWYDYNVGHYRNGDQDDLFNGSFCRDMIYRK